MSDNESEELTIVTFQAVSNGQDAIEILFVKENGNDHFALPAMTINRVDGPSFQIVGLRRDAESGAATITWNSRAGATYIVEFSPDLQRWLELDDGVQSGGETTSFTDGDNAAANPLEGYYRVR